MKRLWYENRFNPKKKGFIYDFGNYAEYFTENMKRRKVVTKLSTAERAMEDKGYEFIGEETEEDFKRRRDGFLYEKFENGERKIAAIQQPEYKGPFDGWYQSKDKSGKIVSVGPYETKEQVERVIREQGFTPIRRRDKGTSIGGTRYRSEDRNSRAEVYPGGQDEYGRELFRVELREDNGHVEELYMTKTKLNRWLDQFGFKPDSQVGQARKSKRSPRLRGRSGILVSFHRTNRGLKFEGEKPFSQIMSENSEYLYTDEDNINITRDESGKIVSEDDPNGETGELEYEYSDYYYTNRIYEYGDLSTDEIEAIKKTRYISDELRDIIN